jgi:ABC-type branched-subunit amino acid transport system substrate-binding protein
MGLFSGAHWGADLDNAANHTFVAAFEKEYGRLPSAYSAQAYDCTVIIALAADEAHSNAPTDFVKHMNDVTGDGTPARATRSARR